jgi:hypothetical protein
MKRSSENGMKNVSAFKRNVGVKSSLDMVDKVGDFLRSMYPQKTAECVAADTGISAKTVSKWLERSSAPGGLAMIHLAMMYGPEFLCAVADKTPAWLNNARKAEKAERIERQLAALQAERDAL